MCRWITLLSAEENPFWLSDVVLKPSQSLITMSVDASFHPGYSDTNNHVMNGDGFGIGWYYCCTSSHCAEQGKVAVRGCRRDANKALDTAKKDSELSEDELKDAKTNVDDLAKKYEKIIDDKLAEKSEEVLKF